MMTPKKLIAIIAVAITFCSSNAQQIKLPESSTISILTCDTGNELHTLFGHTALRINDPENNFDAVYNFGYFDFGTPNFY